ncbi:hypothetical protein GCM10009665_51550 [Kitasatospora nipponensis]|uniref:DUF4190 domain-containing protein n=1 Tax=Kitasatospora nipponensis TaxID=258049 RepID=A0ABP4HB98_9ACTN
MSIPTNEAGPGAQPQDSHPAAEYPPAGPLGVEAYPPGFSGAGYPAPVQEPGKNGFAVAALVFGLIGGFVFGILFGVLGLNRAKKVGRGKAMAWIGIVLSILWIAPIAYFVPHLLKASDPGCVAAKQSLATYNDAKFNADQNDPAALKSDFHSLQSELDAAATKSDNAGARSAIQGLSGDFQQLVGVLDSGTAPAPDLQSRITADAQKVDSACGTIGS